MEEVDGECHRGLARGGFGGFDAVVERCGEIPDDDVRAGCLPHTETCSQLWVVEDALEGFVVESSNVGDPAVVSGQESVTGLGRFLGGDARGRSARR